MAGKHTQGQALAHAHTHDHDPTEIEVAQGPRLALLSVLGVAAVATIVGLVLLWPSGSGVRHAVPHAQYAAAGVTFPEATITKILPRCGPHQDTAAITCGGVEARVSNGPTVAVRVPPTNIEAGLRPGDRLELARTPVSGGPASYVFVGVERGTPIWILFAVFVVVVGLVARRRGLLAIVGLGIGGLLLVKFVLPALLVGRPGLAVALVGSSAIMFVVLYLAHGPSLRTSTALAGTLGGITLTALIGVVAVHAARLSGVSDNNGALLTAFVGDVSFQGLLTCAVIVASLGLLNDVTITQASAVWELRAAGPDLSRRTLFGSAMRIGRDHIASSIYTIVFAYAGTALPILLLLFIYQRPVLDLLTTEDIATEVVKTLASAIGLVLAVPLTTAVAALTVGGARTTD
jgi:uncharacterized membrane protein